MNIEELVRSRLSEAEISPVKASWAGIHRRLRWHSFLKFKPWQFNVYYLGGLLLVGAGLTAYLSGDTVHPDPQENAGQVAVADAEPVSTNAPDIKHVTPQPGILDKRSTNQVAGETGQQEDLSTLSTRESADNQALTDNAQQALVAAGDEQPVETERKESGISATLPAALFTPSALAGCAPLEIKCYNQSVNVHGFLWLFDETDTLPDIDPVYTFNEPGLYSIRLTVWNRAGHSETQEQLVRVYEVPSADFEFSDPIESITGGVESNLLNYTGGALSYHWNVFGSDNDWYSTDFQPIIKASWINEGDVAIQLIATGEQGCTDTVTREIPLELRPAAQALKFPTAFSPNPTGSIGGSYSPNEKRTDIFHPVFVEAPLEYRLRIYTRRGELVFETDNIYIGWDGYFLQERSASDVYVWMAEGRWSDGREFKLQGDVTLLWNGHM